MNSVVFLQTVLFRHLCRCWQRNKDVHPGPLSPVIIKVNRDTEGASYTAAHTWARVCEVGDRADQPLRLCRKWSHYLELLKSWVIGWRMKLWRLVFSTEFLLLQRIWERNRIASSQDWPLRCSLHQPHDLILPSVSLVQCSPGITLQLQNTAYPTQVPKTPLQMSYFVNIHGTQINLLSY